ncbi:MAG: M23 family metallopeptidase [Anaerolineaceae bacterium]|nr:M23 family metallopeptidase [Anaerolineaceae bacterium]
MTGCTQPVELTNSPSAPALVQATDTAVPETPTQIIPTTTQTPTPVSLCSPLVDITLEQLPDFVSNPFSPFLIADARDSGHPGTDFAYYTHPVTGKAMLASEIYAILPGRVASISAGMAPFGNLIMIETALEILPADIIALFDQYPQPTPSVPETHLNCPAPVTTAPGWQYDQPSVYVLYAHMDQPADFSIGDPVSCGAAIGLVGNTGRSGNPHLHLEIRYGPGNAVFGQMGHYSNDATIPEMDAYCTWRVSGIFQAIDPMLLIRAMD